jgi:hypothetical protein
LKKLHSLEPDEPRGNDTEVTGMLLRWIICISRWRINDS